MIDIQKMHIEVNIQLILFIMKYWIQVCCRGNSCGIMWQLQCTSHFNARLPLSVSSSIAMATNSTVSQRWEAAHRFKDSHPKKWKFLSPGTSLKGPFILITWTVMVQQNSFLLFFFFLKYAYWCMFKSRSPKDNTVMPSSAVAHCNQHTLIYKLNSNSAHPKMHCHNARLWMQPHTCIGFAWEIAAFFTKHH